MSEFSSAEARERVETVAADLVDTLALIGKLAEKPLIIPTTILGGCNPHIVFALGRILAIAEAEIYRLKMAERAAAAAVQEGGAS